MKSKKVLAVLLAVLMLLSSVTVAFSVFAADVAEAAAEQAAEEVTYTREELKDISDKYGYDLTEDQIDAIASGETTLSETVGDSEEDVTLIVKLPGEGALAGNDSSEADSEKVQKAQKKLESEQKSVQGRIAKKVMKNQDLDVMYSYSLLTNAFAINAKPSQINEIAAIRGVESVYTAPIYTPVPTDASSVTTDEQKAAKYFTGSDNTTANKGTGTVVAVIDTGLDSSYTYDSATDSVKTTFHKAFQNPVSNPKLAKEDIAAKWELTNAYQRSKNSASLGAFTRSLYRNSKVPYAFAYSEDDIFVGHEYFSYADNPSYWSWAFSYFYDDEQGDHGTHVSGITAGYETDAEGKVVFEGVAPDAQLLEMKVFGNERAGNYADILAAMEDAVLLGADVINLSLGSWAGFTYGGDRPQYDAAFQAAADAGVVVCASAGNEYNAAKGNLYGTDESLASNPDNGIVGSPASYDDNLAVASISSKNYYAKSVIVDGRGIAYTNNATEDERSIEKHSGTVKDYALLKDGEGKLLTGTPGDFENYAKSSGIKGKYAVILRGETFTETVARAEDAGAIGLIVCDHSDGSLVNMMENNDVSIPAIFISKADGEFLVAQESNPEASHQLEITDATTFINNPTAGEMSDFSSWGVTPDLKLKPEITGYGGSVYSTLKGNKYGLMSGTSMSSPYLAGVSALVVQDLNNQNPVNDTSFLNFEAAYVNRLASEIGTLDGSVECEEKIHALEAAIDALPESSKSARDGRVNYANGIVKSYYNQFTVANAQTKLNAIGSVADATGGYLGYMGRMHEARIALESLSATDQAKITATYKNKLRNAQRTLLNSYILKALKTVAYTDDYKALVDASRFWYNRWLNNVYSTISATYLKYLFNAEAQLTVSLINAIGDVELTLACKAKIDEARRYYDNLNNTADTNATAYKAKVTNLATLTAAEEAYAALLQQATTVENVNAYTNNVTQPASIDEFASAATYGRILYNALSDADKAQVTNYAPAPAALAGSAKQSVAKALMMSTATPVLFGDSGIPYSPRKQGAGLVNIDAALASNAYVSVNGTPTPKLDLGDDKAKTGVYEMTFSVVNTGAQDLVFDVSANVQTEKVDIQDVSYQTRRVDPEKADAFKATGLPFRENSYGHRVYAIDELEDVKFMSGEPYDLTAMSTVTPAANTVTVPANASATVTVTVTLGAEAKAYMDENFANGIYVEGFVTLTSKTEGQPDLHVPYLAFYGDWTQAPMLDEGTWEDDFLGNPVHPQMAVSTGANVYWGSMLGNFLYPLGLPNSDGDKTPYDVYEMGATYLKDVRNVFGGTLSLHANMLGAELGLLRSAKSLKFTVTDTQTGEVYATANRDYVRKSVYYSDSVGMVNAGYFDSDLFKWDGKIDGTQNYIEPGTQVTYSVEVLPDYGTPETNNNLRNTFSFNAYYDGETPTIDSLKVYLDEDTSDVMLDIAASDDYFLGEISYGICGYVEGEVEETTYMHTLFMPETKGGTATETLNLSEWARTGGLKQMRSVRITLSDFCQKDAVNEHPVFSDSYNDEYWISFFDKVKVSSITDILPVGAEGQLNVDYIYGRKLLTPDTPWYDAEGDANNNDYGVEEDFIYLSSNPEVLRITSEGKLIPVSAGYADVTATGRYGKASDTMRIRVVEDPTQLEVAAANAGDTVTVSEDVAASSLLIDKDVTIDLGGNTLHGVDGSPAIRVIGGNVTIKNGSVDAVYSDNSQNAPLIDILEDNVPAILVEGGNVTLDNLKISGAAVDVDGEKVIAGSAVVLKDDGNLTVKSSDLLGLYALNNSEAANAATFVSGNFEGVLGAVADMKKLTKSEGSEFIDITNTLADDDLSYLGTIEGGSTSYYLPQTGLYISAEQLAAATPAGGSTVTYDAERNCAVFTFNGADNAVNSYLEIPNVNIENCEDYKFAAILTNGLPSNLTYTYAGFSSSAQTNNSYLSGEEYAPTQDGSGKIRNYIKPLSNCEYFTGSAPTLYFWPGAGTYRKTDSSMDIYGVALFTNKADAMSFATGTANVYTNNLKVAAPQSFNTQMVIDGTTLNVSTSFPDESDGKYKWTANELALYTRVVDSENNFTDTFVESKPITPDENGDVSVTFEGIDPSKAYVVKAKFALALTADSKSSFFSLSEASAAGLVKAFPEMLDEMLGVNELEASVADLLNFFLYDMREGFVERDARHYDCPLTSSTVNKYPYIDEYPDIIPQGASSYTTWLSYWDNQTFNEFIGTDKVNYDDTVTRISFAILFASILGDAKMAELMANIESTVPAKTWNMLNENMRVGNFGLVGSIPTYKAQLEALQNAATGATPREQFVNAVSYLANNFIDLYASVLSVINSTYAEGVSFASYRDPTSNDSLLNVLDGKNITDTYNYGKYNDRQAEMIEKVNAVRASVAYIQNAKNGLMKAMNAALYGTLASYQTEASDLMSLYFDENAISGGVLDLGRTAEYEAEANYDGFITYELNGGVNDEANPIGYQRVLPVTFAAPTKEGYAFDGWYTSPDFAEGTKITGTTDSTEGDITVYAKWSIQSYVMTFMLGDTVVDSVTYTYGEQTKATDKLSVATGLSFKYWYGEDSSKAYEFGKMPAHDVTLKAQLSYMSLDDFTKNGDTYVWPKDDNASLRLTVDRNCTIDFGGKVVSNMNDLAIIVVEGGKTVTIKNAIFAPADYLNTSNETATVLVNDGSKLTLENCVIKGAVTRTENGAYASCSAVKVSDGRVTAKNCVLTGLYAIDNTKGSFVMASPVVEYTTGVYAGQIAPFAAATNVSMTSGRVVDASAFVNDASASDLYASHVKVVAPSEFNVNSFDFEYLPDTDEVEINPVSAVALDLPDGTNFTYVPTAAGFDDTIEPLVDGSVKIGNFMVGTHKLQANYSVSMKLAEDTAAFIYQLDDGMTAASKKEVSAFDALLPDYANIITKWNNNKDKIIQKFAQYADNALLKIYLDEIRTAIDNINGTGSKEGILPRLQAKLDAYKALTSDSEKLAWLLANKADVIALTIELDDNSTVIASNCMYLNAMAQTFFGTDYSDKLQQVFEIQQMVNNLRIAAEKQPSFAAAEYASASDKNAFVASLLSGTTAYAGEAKVEGVVDLGDKVTFTRYIDPTNESFSAPTKFTVLQNSMLKDIVIPEEFPRIEWKVPNTELKELGTFAVTAVYTPTDTVKYNIVEFTIDVEVISPATYCERNGHNYGDLIIVDADCTTDGNATRVCSMCGDVKVEEVYKKLGHIDEDNNNICDRCKEYINDTGRGGVNLLLGALNYISSFFRGVLQLLTRSSGSSTGGTGSGNSGSGIFASDSFIVRFLRWLFRNI